MELIDAIHRFTDTLATLIPVAIVVAISFAFAYIGLQDFLRKRAKSMWRKL